MGRQADLQQRSKLLGGLTKFAKREQQARSLHLLSEITSCGDELPPARFVRQIFDLPGI